jgi:antitoxin HicB
LCSAAGREPVREWLLELSSEDRKIIGKDILVVHYEWPLGLPLVDHLRNGISGKCAAFFVIVRPACCSQFRVKRWCYCMASSRKRAPRRPKRSGPPSGGVKIGKSRNKEQEMNEHRGSSFDDVLRDEGIHDETHAAALKQVVARLLQEGMVHEGVTKPEMARRMGTSRSQLDRVLDPANVTIQLDTLLKAARAVGRRVSVTFEAVSVGKRALEEGRPPIAGRLR